MQLPVRKVHFDKKGALDLGVYLKISRFIKDERIDAVQSFLGNHHAYISSLLSGKPAIGGIRSTAALRGRGGFAKELLLPMLLAKTGSVTVVSNSYAGRDLFVKKGFPVESLRVIPNGIEPRFRDGDRAKAIAELGLKGKKVIGTIGRLPQKNHERLIDLFAESAREDMALLIIGDGPLRGYLQQRIDFHGLEKQVIMAGARKDIPDILAAIDVFISLSSDEGWPNAIGEAMQAGKTVVCLDAGDIREMIRDGCEGVIAADAKDAMSKAMDLLDEPLLREEIGRYARDAMADYTIEELALRYDRLYAEVGEMG